MGRKSRVKRDRRADGVAASLDAAELAGDDAAVPSVAATVEAAARGRPARPVHVGARVARVAVDDNTWAAFRGLCGDTPASIRLGQLVEADVQRAHEATPESDAVAAVRAIRAHADQLEAFIRDGR
jgi:NADPH-dependent ferric siderophore reductase